MTKENSKKITKNEEPTHIYKNIRNTIVETQTEIIRTVNSAIVDAYWHIGEQIYKECGENDRAEYGKYVLKYLSEKLTAEFGKGFDINNLRLMRQFYLAFPKCDAVRRELSWTHYRLIMRVDNTILRCYVLIDLKKSARSPIRI